MKDFRGPLPLDDRDFAEVRGKVLAKIERKPVVWRYALAAAAVIALVMVLWPRPTPTPVVAKKNTVETAFRPSPQPPAQPPMPRAEARVHIKPKKARAQQVVASAGAPPSDAEITMNIETADPNVRIIWITR